MSGIRVTYSGLIGFIVSLVSIITALITLLIITRTLSAEEFGTWRLIIYLVLYVTYIQPTISYWVTRETARSIDSGKTALLSNGLFSCIAVALYVVIAYSISDQSNTDMNILLSSFIIIPAIFFYNILSSINYGWKPHVVHYGAVVLEGSKIPILLVTLVWFELGVFGVIIAITIAYIPGILLHLIYAKQKIKDKINFKFTKKWLKLSWLPGYNSLSTIIMSLDVLIFTIITGSVIGLAFHGAAWLVARLSYNAAIISNAVYPKLLEAKVAGNIIQKNITLLSFIAIPLTLISMFFAKPGLYALNPIYEGASIAIIFMTIRCTIFVYSSAFAQYLTGNEKVDVSENTTFKQYIRSKLFLVPSTRLIQYSGFLITLTLVLMMVFESSTYVELVTYWSIIWALSEVPFLIYFYILVKKNFTFKLEISNLTKYLLIGIISFGVPYFLSLEFLEFNPNVFEFLPNVLLFVGSGIFIYLMLTYFLDNRTRELFSAVINEIKKR